MTVLPLLVANLAHSCEAWIVGSAAKEGTDLSKVRDWDVVIPFSFWTQAAALIPKDAKPNTFGGWKCETAIRLGFQETVTVDVWPDDLGILLTDVRTKFAWHPRSGARVWRL